MITILLVFKDRPTHPMKPPETPGTLTSGQPLSPDTTNPTSTAPPPTQGTSPDVTATPPIVLENKTPVATPPPPTDTSTSGDRAQTPTIPPLIPPAKPRMSAAQLEQLTEKIQTAMNEQLKTLRLQTVLRGISLNPATDVLTISYEVPLLKGPAETKEGLLYSGFELIWVADNNAAGNIVRYSLSGYGHLAPGQPAKLALNADVSPQQASEARSVADYAAVAKEMSNVWWHDDIASAEL
jgi:hypothetical protein